MLDLDQIRNILAPLDLSPLFAVVGGEHLFGIATPDSEVRVRGVHRQALAATLGPGRRAPNIELELLERGLSVRLFSEDQDRLSRRIERGDGPLLEELHSPYVLSGDAEVEAIRAVAVGGLSRRIRRYYHALARAALWRLEGEKTKRTQPILALYRSALAGIHLFEQGEVVPDLGRLAAIYELPEVTELLDPETRPHRIGDPAHVGMLISRAYELLERLEHAEESSTLPAEPPPPEEIRERLAAAIGPG